MVKLKLSKPAKLGDLFNKGDGSETSDLELREPTGNDLIECGMPWRWEINDVLGGSIRKMDTPVIAMLISRLSGVSLAAVNAMTASDFVKASGAVLGFFQDLASAETIPSTNISS